MKLYRYIGLVIILCFSFLYAERIANFTLEKNKLYQEINNNKDTYTIKPVNAIISDSYITPGINGKKVNVKKSYYKMKNIQTFNELYLVFNIMQPDISLNNNLDRIINKGNELKNGVAFVIDNNKEIIDYLINNNIPASILITMDTFNKDSKLEQINNDEYNYSKVDILLNKYHKNTNICYLNSKLDDLCRKNHKYLVKSAIVVDNSNFINIKNNIISGDIYYISKNLSINNMELLIKTIQFKDLHIMTLSDLISEDKS